ncbi:hypothetical protein Dsin_012966 [Dipteronia sinensis]|uniref:Reverse transcriptase zinc-binding domain-containing protein n=1 Tax=Dipteronia sinensis TaxID=43782 RepID=A0AAE0AJ17_9ROSI|nr:hypothetical protein Dsin_012966 [Dipteronia sinensis]
MLETTTYTSYGGGNGCCWKNIWNMELPSKIKIFLWKACHNWLPKMVNLARRRVSVDGFCPVCKNNYETTLHAIWGCSGLKVVRSSFGFLKGMNSGKFQEFQDFFNSCVQTLDSDVMVLLCVIWWRNWHLRNQLVHESGRSGLKAVVSWSMNYISNYRDAMLTGAAARKRDVIPKAVKWEAPRRGVFKLNTDAALDVRLLRTGLGMVIRDHTGFVMASWAQRLEANYSPLVAEAMAIFRGITFAVEAGLVPIVVESDALAVVNLINAGDQIHAEIGLVVCDIRNLLKSIECGQVVFVFRMVNVVAHLLAKLALSLDEGRFWIEEYPLCVETVYPRRLSYLVCCAWFFLINFPSKKTKGKVITQLELSQ